MAVTSSDALFPRGVVVERGVIRCVALLATALFLLAAPELLADYLWPLPYGNELSSGYGNSRSRRYHLGLDVRTGGRGGRPVVAPESGYISRVRASYYGYGKALYLQMRDGRVAVFGHLSRFNPGIESYLLEHQLSQESYQQDLFPLSGQFSFDRGDTIGWSGSTGVGAPHLHFEIRSGKNLPLNPLLLPGLAVADKRAPVFESLLLVTGFDQELAEALGIPSVIPFSRDRKDGIYRLSQPLPALTSAYWLSVSVTDKIGRNNWKKAVYSIELWQSRSLIFRRTHDSLSFGENYLIDAHRDYSMARAGDKYFENLFDSEMVAAADGIQNYAPYGSVPFVIVATDAAGNRSEARVEFDLSKPQKLICAPYRPEYDELATLLANDGQVAGELKYLFRSAGDRLLLLLHDSAGDESPFWIVDLESRIMRTSPLGNGYHLATAHRVEAIADSEQAASSVYLRRISTGETGETFELHCDFQVPHRTNPNLLTWQSEDGRLELFSAGNGSPFFPAYDNYYLRIIVSDDGSYAIEPNDRALQRSLTFSYRLPSDSKLPKGAGLYSKDERGLLRFLGADLDSTTGTLSAQSSRLVDVGMKIDTVAPSIRKIFPRNGSRVEKSRPVISAELSDTLSGIDSDIEVRVDGKWLVPVYDFESGQVTAVPHFDLAPGKHRLDITVADRIGNRRHYTGSFTYAH